MMPHSQINPFISRVATYLLEIATGAHSIALFKTVGTYLIINNSNKIIIMFTEPWTSFP